MYADLKIKYEKAKIEINENIDQKLFQEAVQIIELREAIMQQKWQMALKDQRHTK